MCHSARTTSECRKSDFKFSQNQATVHRMSANSGEIIGGYVAV